MDVLVVLCGPPVVGGLYPLYMYIEVAEDGHGELGVNGMLPLLADDGSEFPRYGDVSVRSGSEVLAYSYVSVMEPFGLATL